MARHVKPYRLYFRKDTGFWYYKLPGQGWRSTECTKEHEALAKVLEKAGPRPEVPAEPAARKPTLREFAADFFEWGRCAWIRRRHAAGQPFGRTVARGRRGHLLHYLFPRFGDLPLDRIKVKEVEDWLLELPLANQTKNHIVDSFRIVLTEAVRQEILPTNPLANIVRMANVYRARDAFSLEECMRLFPRRKAELLRVWKEPKWAALFYTMLTTGIRVSEAAALQWRHILWETPAMLLVEQAVKADGRTVGKPKAGDVRAVLLPRRTRYTLAWWREKSPCTEPDDFVFPGEGPGWRLHPKTIGHRFPLGLKEAGIETKGKVFCAHSLRHTYTSQMTKMLPEALLRYMVGHRSETVTARYRHLSPADRLRALLPGAPPRPGQPLELNGQHTRGQAAIIDSLFS